MIGLIRTQRQSFWWRSADVFLYDVLHAFLFFDVSCISLQGLWITMRDDLQLLLCRSKRNGAVLQHENIRHSTCFSDQVMFGSVLTVNDGNVHRRLSISPVRVCLKAVRDINFP
jgi:hypothetical protein